MTEYPKNLSKGDKVKFKSLKWFIEIRKLKNPNFIRLLMNYQNIWLTIKSIDWKYNTYALMFNRPYHDLDGWNIYPDDVITENEFLLNLIEEA